MAIENNYQIGFFNLNKDNDSAIIRILHSSVSTIESANIHLVNVNNKKKSIKCINTDNIQCPLCAENVAILNRIYIHLFDYTDNKEKIWSRTDKILPQLKEIENNWGNLSNCVLKITRIGNDFPKYTIGLLNPSSYPQVQNTLIDNKLAYRFYLTRSADELNTFINTGVLPDHIKKQNQSNQSYVPKSENNTQFMAYQNNHVANSQQNNQNSTNQFINNDLSQNVSDNPFANPFLNCQQQNNQEYNNQNFIDPFSIKRV